MIVKHGCKAHWCCYLDSEQALTLPDITELLAQISCLPNTLKDDRRSLVKQGSMLGKTVVAKQPRDKLRKKWSRALSLITNAETKKTFISLIEFKQKDINSVQPLFALEKRAFGMVTDSWLVYEFRDGQPCQADSLPEIVSVLQDIHAKGYRHDDPNFGNFMRAQDGSIFLIDFKGRARAGSFSDYYDFILLSKINADSISSTQVEQLVEFNRASFGYFLSRAYLSYKTTRTRLKELFRRRRNKKELN